MKRIIVTVLFLSTLSFMVSAQSKSYSILKHKFSNSSDVHSFSLAGWVCRLAFNFTGDYEFKKAVEDVQQVRFITIPRKEFEAKDVTVKGFKRLLLQDSYQQLAHIRENGEDVSIYLKESGNKRNYYFVLIEGDNEVVAIELKGYINPEVLKNNELALR